MGNLFGMIRMGVKLRPMKKEDSDDMPSLVTSPPSEIHLQMLQNRLRKINMMTHDSSPECDDNDDDNDFDD